LAVNPTLSGSFLTMAAPKPDFAALAVPGDYVRRRGESPAADRERQADHSWARVPAILARIPALSFPPRDHVVTDYGAVGDGRTDDHAAIVRAIAACADAGGGRVIVPPGDYLTGPLHLRSFVNLHVCAGATLRFTTDSCRYLPPVFTRWEGIECMGLSPLIYAFEQEHVAVTGGGVLDGQAGLGRWWNWAGPWEGALPTGWTPGQPHQAAARNRLQRWGESGTPVHQRVFTERDLLRPMFVQFYRCHDVLVEGVTLRNTPMWGIHPVLCRAVTVRRIEVISPGPNNDGCVPDSSRDVLVEDCLFDTGDDCVAIKAGRNHDGWRVDAPAEDIVIRGCRMRGGHSALAIGSEISGQIHRIFVERCTMNGAQLDHVVRIKANSTRGGVVEQIRLRDLTASRAREAAVRVDLRYDEAVEQGDRWPQVRDVAIERLGCEQSGRALWIEGLPAMPVRDVHIAGSIFRRVEAANILHHVEGFTARGVVFPAPA
jgi:polygalacturonase